ncbi:MAG TPA: ABC transporter ATP-binding protein [Solirubrobacteraceae bacterium]|nr:ABC transporter ATP-binding protein [Solirubrobacteraceae bacterium]
MSEASAEPDTAGREEPVARVSWRRELGLLRYARPHWRGFAGMLVAALFGVAINLARPWPLKLLIDNVIDGKRIPHWLTFLPGADGRHGLLGWVVASEVVIFLAGTIATMITNYTSLTLGQRMTWSLAGDLFRHLQRLSLLFHTRREAGDLIERVTTDSYSVDTLLTGAVLPTIQAVATLASVLVVMLALDWRLTLLAVSVVPLIALTARFFGRPLRERSREQRDSEGRMASVVEQTLGAMPAVQAFTREPLQELRFRRHAEQTVRAYARSALTGMGFQLVTGLVLTLGAAAVIYVGGTLALEGVLTAGTIVVFVSYVASLYEPIEALSHTAQTIQNAAAETDRVMEIMEIEPAVSDRPGATDRPVSGAIGYEHVVFGYEPDRPVLHDISFTAEPDQVLAIVGPTGAGKTTLVSLLVRFFDPWQGRVTIGGSDVRDFTLRSLRSQIALVLQDPFIFPTTIAENIALGRPDATREQIVAAAEAANAHSFIQQLRDGYDTLVGERGATLSGGEKQRLSIARAFVKDAPMLVLDEPTSALDARTEGLLLEALERLMSGRITLVIAHRLSTIRGADEILVLEHGRITEHGPHERLIAADGLYRSLYRQQMQIAEHDLPAVVPSGRA